MFIVGATSIPQLTGDVSVYSLSITGGGSLDLNSFTLTAVDMATITTAGAIMPRSSAVNGKIMADRFTISNANFTDIELEKSGATTSNSTINNAVTFSGNTIITNNNTAGPPAAVINIGGTLASVVVFDGPATFNRNNANINLAANGMVTFNDKATFNVLGQRRV
ncbi:MAG: hypothetical protein IPN33_21590 [Saprospiraceae bacterium]|nr:hypothetical protein [Saprospiraceae bacterium]